MASILKTGCPPCPVMSPGRKVLSHVGELYGGRSASPLLHSLRRLVDSGKLSPQHFQVYLVGPVAEGSIPDPAFITAASQEGWVKLIAERITQKDAHQIVQTSDALLLIQPQTALQVPGKLFDYLQIGRPILAFIPHNSPVERILQRAECRISVFILLATSRSWINWLTVFSDELR